MNQENKNTIEVASNLTKAPTDK